MDFEKACRLKIQLLINLRDRDKLAKNNTHSHKTPLLASISLFLSFARKFSQYTCVHLLVLTICNMRNDYRLTFQHLLNRHRPPYGVEIFPSLFHSEMGRITEMKIKDGQFDKHGTKYLIMEKRMSSKVNRLRGISLNVDKIFICFRINILNAAIPGEPEKSSHF